jgi:hypothetical protein
MGRRASRSPSRAEVEHERERAGALFVGAFVGLLLAGLVVLWDGLRPGGSPKTTAWLLLLSPALIGFVCGVAWWWGGLGSRRRALILAEMGWGLVGGAVCSLPMLAVAGMNGFDWPSCLVSEAVWLFLVAVVCFRQGVANADLLPRVEAWRGRVRLPFAQGQGPDACRSDRGQGEPRPDDVKSGDGRASQTGGLPARDEIETPRASS